VPVGVLVETVAEEGEFFAGRGVEEKWPKEGDLRRFAVEMLERRLVSARALVRGQLLIASIHCSTIR
jgi:hypothetical protein